MSLKINDLVEVTITNCNLFGLHDVKITNFDNYDAILLPCSKIKKKSIYFKGLKMRARVVRLDRFFVDVVEYD